MDKNQLSVMKQTILLADRLQNQIACYEGFLGALKDNGSQVNKDITQFVSVHFHNYGFDGFRELIGKMVVNRLAEKTAELVALK
jgi:hypothetical protein